MLRLLSKRVANFSQAQANLAYPLYNYAKDIPEHTERTHWNLFQAVNSAMDIALETDPTYLTLNSALKSSDKMSNSEECLDAQLN